MSIKGFQGTSLLDYPGRVASLIYWGGCNLTCPFCHNPALVLEPESCADIDRSELLAELAGRRPFIDGVVVSGGEPTLDDGLPAFLTEIKGLGLAVKLDTNGLEPQCLAGLLSGRLIDYLAIDLKTLPERYPDLHSGPVMAERLLETIALCREAGITVEYRTTCVPGWVDESVVRQLGKLIEGAPFWALQQYHAEHALCAEARAIEAYAPERIRAFAEIAAAYVGEVTVRGL